MTNPTDQCSRCTTVADLIDQGTTSLEDCASVIGCPTPSLHVHLVQHDRDDLLRALTYQGEPILPVGEVEVAAEVVDMPTPEPAPELPSCACDAWEFDPGETEFTDDGGVLHTVQRCWPPITQEGAVAVTRTPAADWPEGTDPQELIDAGLVTPDEVEDDGLVDAEILCGTDFGFECSLPGGHHTECGSEMLALAGLRFLDDNDPDEQVRMVAATLIGILTARDEERADRQRLVEIVAQRDALNAEIEALAQRLGDFPAPEIEPAAEPEPVAAEPKRPTEAQLVREWAREQGIKVGPHGRLPAEIVQQYREAVHP